MTIHKTNIFDIPADLPRDGEFFELPARVFEVLRVYASSDGRARKVNRDISS